MKSNQETLQIAIDEHRRGNLKKAEQYYLKILQSEQNHPHANHNLGLLKKLISKPEDALPLLEKALERDPKEEQFWVSYVETLIEANHLDKALNVLAQAKENRINSPKLATYETYIKNSYENVNQKNLLGEINNLIGLYHNNLFDEAENKAKEITQHHPEHYLPWKMLGVLLSRKENWHKSELSFQKVLEIEPKEIESLSNLAAVQHELGKHQLAKETSNKALMLDPNYAQAHYNLGRAQYELGELANAEVSYRKAIEINPKYADAYCNLGLTLEGAGRALEAVEYTRIALSLKPELHQAQHNLGVWLLSLKQYREAEEELKKSVLIKKENEEALLSCYLNLNKEKEFYKVLESISKTDRISSLLGSVCSRAELRYEKKTINPYCSNPMNYVIEKNISKNNDFSKTFVKPLREISDNLTEQRLQGLLTNGKQSSGNLFITEKEKTKDIQNIIHEEVEKYRDRFKNSNEGLIQKWPKKYKLYGWLVAMKTGGKLSAHMHETGWISGSIYINVPQKNNKNDGNIAFCIEEEQFLPAGQKSPEKIVDVITGSMCLFPSSLLHYTIPFDSEEERIVFAFDIQPDK